MKDAAHFRDLAKRIERRSKTDKSQAKRALTFNEAGDPRHETPSSVIRSIAGLSLST